MCSAVAQRSKPRRRNTGGKKVDDAMLLSTEGGVVYSRRRKPVPCTVASEEDDGLTLQQHDPLEIARQTTSTTAATAHLGLQEWRSSWTEASQPHMTASGSWNSRSPSGSYEDSMEGGVPALNGAAPINMLHKKTQYHKTKMCPWHREGKCFMGASCNYAHNRDDLRPKPDLSKTKMCPEIMNGKRCDRQSCRFAHDFVELRATSTFFKTRICKYWQRGFCPAGEECRHAHGREDLRVILNAGHDDSETSVDGSTEETPDKITAAPPPLATCLPSPSFMSTSASTPLAGSTNVKDPTKQLIDLLGGTMDSVTVLREFISREVQKHWAACHQSSGEDGTDANKASADESVLLPQSVVRSLNEFSPGGCNMWNLEDDAAAEQALSPSFQEAVRLLAQNRPQNERTPTRILLKTLDGLTTGLQYENPPLCGYPFSAT